MSFDSTSEKISSSLIKYYDFITNSYNDDQKTNDKNKIILNAFKINRLILDVLTPVLQIWLQNFIVKNQISQSVYEFFEELFDGIGFLHVKQFKIDRSYSEIKKTLDNVKKENKNEYPNDFSMFDITFCVSLFKNIFDFQPIHGWHDKYSEIKMNKFNQADAFNYSRLIRNKFYGHTIGFKVQNDEYDKLTLQLDEIFKKLNIDQELKSLSEQIKSFNDLTNEKHRNKLFERWNRETKCISNQISFNKCEIIEKDVKISIDTKYIQLTSIYIQQSLNENEISYLTFQIDQFISLFDEIDQFLKSEYGKQYSTILIKCFKNKQDNPTLIELISKFSFKSIIIVGIGPTDSFKQIELNSFNLNNFDNETKMKLLEKPIKFQQKSISIKDLIGIKDTYDLSESLTDVFGSIDSYILEMLISNENIVLLNKNDDQFNEIKNYYINRTFKRSIKLRNDLLRDEEFKITNHVVYTEEDYNKTYQDSRNIHLLRKDSNGSLEWIKSNRNISDLSKFLTNDVDLFNETEFLDRTDKIMIICEEPGMGKSTIVSSLVNQIKSNPKRHLWFIKIILNEKKNELRAMKKKEVFSKIKPNEFIPIDFLIKELLKISSDLKLEQALLKNLANSNKLILIFDGFDEVIDYKNELIILIQEMRKSNINKIIITSREHAKSELEDQFNTISYQMKKFDENNQIEFLIKYWKNSNQQLDENKLQLNAKRIIDRFRNSFSNRKIDDLIGIPLQMRMLAEIYQDDINMEAIDFKNLADLYEKFIKRKFEIKFEEKNHCQGDNEDEEKEDFNDYHYKYSLKLIFNKKTNETERKREEKMKNKLKSYGIIVDFDEKLNPKFLHQSYAEYFIAESICLNRFNDEYKNEIKYVFIDNKFSLIRIFVNDIIENTQKHINIHWKEIFNDSLGRSDQAIRSCCIENLYFLLNHLIKAGFDFKEKRFEDGKTALHLASENGHKDIVELLIKNGINIFEKDVWFGRNALHYAAATGHKLIFELLISKGIDLNEKDIWYSRNALHYASETGQSEIVKILIDKNAQLNEKDKYGKTALHMASEYGNKEIVEFLLNKDVDLNQKELWFGRNELHLACSSNLIKPSKELVQLLINKFIENQIDLNERDNEGKNALEIAAESNHTDIVELLRKVIN